MLKKIYLSLFALIGLSSLPNYSQAQSKEAQEATVIFSEGFCKCAAPRLSRLDKDVVDAMIAMPKDKTKTDEYFNSFDESFLKRMSAQMAEFQAFSKSKEFLAFTENINAQLEPYKATLGADYFEKPEFLKTVIKELEGSTECQLPYLLLKTLVEMQH